jgi:hypothetical protein
MVNNLILMPVYSTDRSAEQANRAFWEQQGYRVVGVKSDYTISWGGVVHCMTKSIPLPRSAADADSSSLSSWFELYVIVAAAAGVALLLLSTIVVVVVCVRRRARRAQYARLDDDK